MVYQRVRVLDVMQEPRDETKAQAVFNADEVTMVDVLNGGKESLDEIVGLPDFPAQLSNFLVHVPELPF